MLSKDKLEALARYAPILEARGFTWGDWKIPPVQVTWMEHYEVASSFTDDAYRYDWVSGDFDWPRWSRTMEVRRLREDPSALTDADAEQLVKLITCSVRSDRFNEGALAADYDSGLLARIASRARTLAALMPREVIDHPRKETYASCLCPGRWAETVWRARQASELMLEMPARRRLANTLRLAPRGRPCHCETASPRSDDAIVVAIAAICADFESYGYRRVGAALRHTDRMLWHQLDTTSLAT